MFTVMSSWQSHCESSFSSRDTDEYSAAPSDRDLWTKPNGLSQRSAYVGSHIYIDHRYLLLLLNPKADTHFTVPRKAEG